MASVAFQNEPKVLGQLGRLLNSHILPPQETADGRLGYAGGLGQLISRAAAFENRGSEYVGHFLAHSEKSIWREAVRQMWLAA